MYVYTYVRAHIATACVLFVRSVPLCKWFIITESNKTRVCLHTESEVVLFRRFFIIIMAKPR